MNLDVQIQLNMDSETALVVIVLSLLDCFIDYALNLLTCGISKLSLSQICGFAPT